MVPALRSDELWHHPGLAARLDGDGPALRADLLRLADHAPRLLDLLDTLPLTFAHGDASPQNLLVDARDPSTFVVIDWGFGTPMAVGFDLGQLLVGLMHAGVVDPDEAPAIDAALVAPYTRGACEEGLPVTEEEVRLGYHVSLALRTALVSLPVEELDGPDTTGLRTLVDQRVRLTRQVLALTREATAVQTGHELASKSD
jgi:hypothetical protein